MARVLLLTLFSISVVESSLADSTDLIQSTDLFSPSGKLKDDAPISALAQEIQETMRLERSLRVESQSATEEAPKVEHGVLNGVHYRFYYKDGSGTFAGTNGNVGNVMEPSDSNWSVGCSKDVMNDLIQCYMHMRHLWIFTYPSGATTIHVGTEHFPNSTAALRIEKGTPYTAPAGSDGMFNKQVSTKIIRNLSNGRMVATRYMEWPYESWVDEQWTLFGFEEAYKYIQWATQHIK